MSFPKADIESFNQVKVALVIHFDLAWVEHAALCGQEETGAGYLIVAQETVICSCISSGLGFDLSHIWLRCGGLWGLSAF